MSDGENKKCLNKKQDDPEKISELTPFILDSSLDGNQADAVAEAPSGLLRLSQTNDVNLVSSLS